MAIDWQRKYKTEHALRCDLEKKFDRRSNADAVTMARGLLNNCRDVSKLMDALTKLVSYVDRGGATLTVVECGLADAGAPAGLEDGTAYVVMIGNRDDVRIIATNLYEEVELKTTEPK